MGEILDSLGGVTDYIKLPGAIVVFTFALIFIILFITHKKLKRIKNIPVIVMILVLIAGSIVSHFRKDEDKDVFLPKAESSAIKNMYNVLSWANGKEIFKDKNIQIFKPYRVDKEIDGDDNVVVIMGESLGAKYMSLFGFEKETTPYLDSVKDRLEYSWGYSCGVTTDVAVPTFFLLKREPKNTGLLLSDKTNLFAMAKKAGYKTYYITTQKLTVMGGFLANSVDVVKSRVDFKEPIIDEYLSDFFKSLDLKGKNFIVLHQRNSHSPYDHNTPKRFWKYEIKNVPYKEYMRNAYYNSLQYSDYIFKEIIEKIDSTESSAVLFITSDHSEMMGFESEEGRFGHSYLGFEDAKVPFIVYKNSECKNEYNLKSVISHYQFGKLIAKSLGYSVTNPNENGEFYINGVDIEGNLGYLNYKKLDKLW
jgi:glucan phosphoethanolaminetransferase (alkaline phosphatase superfamily)